MKYVITWFEKRRLRKVAKRIVWQSPYHAGNIKEYFKILIEEARKEFTEDNDTTLDDFLLEQYRNACKEVLPHSTFNQYHYKRIDSHESS